MYMLLHVYIHVHACTCMHTEREYEITFLFLFLMSSILSPTGEMKIVIVHLPACDIMLASVVNQNCIHVSSGSRYTFCMCHPSPGQISHVESYQCNVVTD